ncbi:hypothetical protein NNO07_22530 [Pseudomonas resinovorans]|uniref:Uncharacterized protein n=1 Tax=Metapseudomonas resinovorans TaxID=53412 RepID=A0ABT4YAF0_METRE|nr:hypothetical protein [Pseudomonas resinovorans]MDA8485853.1 hypothetical protein [Pseudomonas resinovorans]
MATVIVGCKLPHGLQVNLGGVKVVLRGANSSRILGGFGITRDVDKDLIEGWLKAEAKNPIVANGMVFIATTDREADKAASEREGEKSGFEGIDPKKPGKDLKKADD